MMELTFIPLKTPEGATCGFAKVSGGFAELKLHAPVDGQAAVLTESGVVEGPPASRIAVQGGRVQAVAVHEDGQLRCFGIARGAALGAEQVRARLMARRRDAANAKAAREPAAAGAAKAGAGTGGAARAAKAVPDVLETATPTEAPKAAGAARDVWMPAQPEGNLRAAAPEDFAAAVRAAAASAPARGPAAAGAAGEAAPGIAPDAGAVETAAGAAVEEPPKTAVNAPEAETGEAKAAATRDVLETAAAPMETPKAMGTETAPKAGAAARGPQPADAANAGTAKAAAAEAAADVLETVAAASGAAKAAVTVEIVPPADAPKAGAGTQAATGAPKVGAGEEDAEDAPASIEQSAADSESFMALLRRADAAFARLSERHAPGVAPASSTAAQPASAPLRRSARHGEAQPAMQQPAAQPGGSAAPPAPAAPAEPPAAPVVARRFPEDAAQWGEEIDRLLEDCGAAEQREPIANPFPNIFPGARFQRVTRPGMQPHLEGDWQRGGERLRITAVPGAYSPHPPAHLMDFTRYIRARSGGYWIRVTAY